MLDGGILKKPWGLGSKSCECLISLHTTESVSSGLRTNEKLQQPFSLVDPNYVNMISIHLTRNVFLGHFLQGRFYETKHKCLT
jgi:hypothetical protein